MLRFLLCVAFVGVVFGSGGVSPAEYNALVDLYSSLNGERWIDKDNWNSGDPCENHWFGVNCSSSHVTRLRLDKNNLQGSLPSSIGNLFDLETLELSLNSISNTIPTNIGNLRSLSLIDLSSNSLTGAIPSEIDSLTNFLLSSLDLSSNSLSGLVPQFFVTDANTFSYVNLSNNPFICPIPAGAEYTEASCLTVVVDEISTKCFNDPFDDSKTTTVLGNGFGNVELVCLFEFKGEIEARPAFVASERVIYCETPFINFTGCTGKDGEKMIGIGNMSLGFAQGNGYLSVSNSLSINFLNPVCPFALSGPKSSVNLYAQANGESFVNYYGSPMNQACSFPPLLDAVAVCQAGTLLPYRCPTDFIYNSSRVIPKPVLDLTCSDPLSCMWANLPYCPWEYTRNTGVCSVNAYSSSSSYPPVQGKNYVSPCVDFILTPNPSTD